MFEIIFFVRQGNESWDKTTRLVAGACFIQLFDL